MPSSQPFRLPIVLGADNRYLPQIYTVIKSICYHNRNIKFYLFNKDIPSETFNHLNQKLAHLNSEIIDIKINNQQIAQYRTYQHISSASTFFRYFIADYVIEPKALYLDCDLVVNGDLMSLYQIDIENYFLAAVKDNVAEKIHQKTDFNAGVMLINVEAWRKNNISELAIDLSNKYIDQMPDADQSILNLIFNQHHWLRLNRGFNYLIGCDYLFQRFNMAQYIEDLGEELPLIVHFNTEAKPWLLENLTRFRSLYWDYANLDWNEIYQHHQMM
ncbi:glycosyltransferase family 8 protein [Pasteurellaceae bacterium 22721_9_1]